MQTGSIIRKLAAATLFLICSAGIVSALAAAGKMPQENRQHQRVTGDSDLTEATGYISQHQD